MRIKSLLKRLMYFHVLWVFLFSNISGYVYADDKPKSTESTTASNADSGNKISASDLQSDFAKKLGDWTGEPITEEMLYMWSTLIISFRTTGYCDDAIAGVMGNIMREVGCRGPYSVECYYTGSTATCKEDGQAYTSSEFKPPNTYIYPEKAPNHDGAFDSYFNGHGIIGWSGSNVKPFVEWCEKSKFPKIHLEHSCGVRADGSTDSESDGSCRYSNYATHKCTMADMAGQTTYLLEWVEAGNSNLSVEEFKKGDFAGSGYPGSVAEQAAYIWEAKVEVSADEPAQRAALAKSAMDKGVVKACTKQYGGTGLIGAGSADSDNQLMADYLVSAGLWGEDEFVTFNSLVETNLTLPDRSSLSLSENIELGQWRREIANRKESESFSLPREIFMFLGIILIVYSVLIYAAFWFDRVNNFIDLNVLSLITFNKLRVSPDDKASNYADETAARKVVTHTDMLKVSVIGVAIGVMIISGYIFELISSVIVFVEKLFR